MKTLILILMLPALASAQAIFNPMDWPEGKEGPGAKAWAAERAKLPPFTAPRTPDGQPDLQGRWGGTWSGDQIEEIPKFLDVTTPPWESWVSDPADGKLPYREWSLAERIAHREGLGREVWSKDPYAGESWEHACHQGNGEHEQQIRDLGFKWYSPPVPPKERSGLRETIARGGERRVEKQRL